MLRINELGVADRVVIYPGADVVAALLIAKIAIADARVQPKVSVEYSPGYMATPGLRRTRTSRMHS